jgi:hypothetical protein
MLGHCERRPRLYVIAPEWNGQRDVARPSSLVEILPRYLLPVPLELNDSS